MIWRKPALTYMGTMLPFTTLPAMCFHHLSFGLVTVIDRQLILWEEKKKVFSLHSFIVAVINIINKAWWDDKQHNYFEQLEVWNFKFRVRLYKTAETTVTETKTSSLTTVYSDHTFHSHLLGISGARLILSVSWVGLLNLQRTVHDFLCSNSYQKKARLFCCCSCWFQIHKCFCMSPVKVFPHLTIDLNPQKREGSA